MLKIFKGHRSVLIGSGVAATLLTAGVGTAFAATSPSATQNQTNHSTATHGTDNEVNDTPSNEKAGTGTKDGPQNEAPGTEAQDGIKGSVKAPTESGTDKAGSDNSTAEQNETAQLSKLAKIDQNAAKQAALASVTGTVKRVSLDSENGSVVYSVEIVRSNGHMVDVKVDAGNGRVLGQDSGTETGAN